MIKKKFFKKKTGHTGHNKSGFNKKIIKKTTTIRTPDRNRNDEPPKGYDKAKWLKRTPCPGCGSRWHRDCRGRTPNPAPKNTLWVWMTRNPPDEPERPRVRYGLVVDTGAVSNVSGSTWMSSFLNATGRADSMLTQDRAARFQGKGHGTQVSDRQCGFRSAYQQVKQSSRPKFLKMRTVDESQDF